MFDAILCVYELLLVHSFTQNQENATLATRGRIPWPPYHQQGMKHN